MEGLGEKFYEPVLLVCFPQMQVAEEVLLKTKFKFRTLPESLKVTSTPWIQAQMRRMEQEKQNRPETTTTTTAGIHLLLNRPLAPLPTLAGLFSSEETNARPPATTGSTSATTAATSVRLPAASTATSTSTTAIVTKRNAMGVLRKKPKQPRPIILLKTTPMILQQGTCLIQAPQSI